MAAFEHLNGPEFGPTACVKAGFQLSVALQV
jgi:hypothetical protein